MYFDLLILWENDTEEVDSKRGKVDLRNFVWQWKILEIPLCNYKLKGAYIY